MKQEYSVVLILGLLLFAYILDAVVNPLSLPLATPYHYFDLKALSLYPFTTISIVAKSVALFITPLWILSHVKLSGLAKGSALLLLSGLLQLYALQDVATKSQVVPLEWSLSFTLTGVALMIPALLYIVVGGAKKAYKNLSDDDYPEQQSAT